MIAIARHRHRRRSPAQQLRQLRHLVLISLLTHVGDRLLSAVQHYHQFNSGLNAKLFINAVKVTFDCAFAHTKCVSDFLIRKSFMEQSCNLLLAIAEGRKSFRDL